MALRSSPFSPAHGAKYGSCRTAGPPPVAALPEGAPARLLAERQPLGVPGGGGAGGVGGRPGGGALVVVARVALRGGDGWSPPRHSAPVERAPQLEPAARKA